MENQSKRTARNEEIKKMVLAATLIAIIALMTFVPGFGYITIAGIDITIVHIPVIVGGVLLGRKYGLVLGLVFGLGSLAQSFVKVAYNAPFTNPIVSVLPRMFVGFIASDVYNLFTKLIKNDKVSVPFAMGGMTLIHSATVLPLLYVVWNNGWFFMKDEFVFQPTGTIAAYVWGLFISNALLEIALAIMIGTPIVIALNIIKKRQK